MKRNLLLAVCLLAATPVLAETQIFVVDNTDGYEIDRCLAAGEPCGAAAAAAICRTRQDEKAVEYGHIEASEITSTVTKRTAKAAQVVAVTCAR